MDWGSVRLATRHRCKCKWVSRLGLTRLDHVHTNILDDSINLLLQKLGRHVVNIVHGLRVLRREGCRGSHGVAAVGGDDLLVCLEAAAETRCVSYLAVNLITQTRSKDAKKGHVRSARAVRAGNYQHSP